MKEFLTKNVLGKDIITAMINSLPLTFIPVQGESIWATPHEKEA